MEKLLVLLFFAIVSSVYNWYVKKQGAAGHDEQPGSGSSPSAAPPAGQAPPPVKRTSWEEELRRLLEGEPPVTPVSRPRPAPPPVVMTPPSRPISPPPVRPAVQRPARPGLPPPVQSKRTQSGRPPPPPPHTHTHTHGGGGGGGVRLRRDPRTHAITHPVGRSDSHARCPLVISSARWPRQSRPTPRQAGLDKGKWRRTSPRFRRKKVKPTYVSRAGVLPEVVETAALFKNVRGARQAMIATFILGPPRALEQLS